MAECCKGVADVGGLPESKLAILAEGFVVQRAQLAEAKGTKKRSLVPASVASFAHSRAKWALADKYASMIICTQPQEHAYLYSSRA